MYVPNTDRWNYGLVKIILTFQKGASYLWYVVIVVVVWDHTTGPLSLVFTITTGALSSRNTNV